MPEFSKIWIMLVAVAILAACAERGEIRVDPTAAAVGDVVPIFIGTTRGFDPALQRFTAERSEVLGF
ncbi:MAG: hypothetical protein ACRC6I_13360, partial [Paracoccaceae bacterium]